MRILVIGAEGQVGTFFTRVLKQHEISGTAWAAHPDYPALDIRNYQEVKNLLAAKKPQAVILTAALAHVDRCEEVPQEAQDINVLGPQNVAEACKRINAHLTFFSTDYVFDGQNGPYRETDQTNPLSVYGRTKLEAEKRISQILERYLIIRTMVVFSYLPNSVNLFMQILSRFKNNETITQPHDQWVNPTQAENLTRVTGELLEQGAKGIFHVAGTTLCTRYEFAQKVVESLGGNPQDVRSLATADSRQKAARPLKSGLVTAKAAGQLTKTRLWSLAESLDFTLAQMASGEPGGK
jgi:dTDP-4-dehydrorhamnose reductase